MIFNIYVSSEQRSEAVVPLEHYVPGTFGSEAAEIDSACQMFWIWRVAISQN